MKEKEKTALLDEAEGTTAENISSIASLSEKSADALGKLLAALYRSFTLYPSNHPSIRETEQRLLELLGNYFKECDRVTVGFLGEDLVVLARNLEHLEGSVPGLNKIFLEQGVEKVRFLTGLNRDELGHFFSSLTVKPDQEAQKEPSMPANDEKCPHIFIGRFKTEKNEEGEVRFDSSFGLDDAGIVKEFFESCQGLVSQIRDNMLIEFKLAKDIIQNVLSGIILEDEAIPIVSKIKAYDEYTFTHILNVSTLSLAMGRVLGFTQQQLRELGLAALLHDAGKLMVPLEILQKRSRLTQEEFEIVRMHSTYGTNMLMKIKELPDLVPIVAFEHHMHFQGGGYPEVRQGYKPHLCSRITAIADIFDALRTNRAYRPEFSKVEALKEMSTMPVDPYLFNLFARIASLYAVGDYVWLDNNEVGMVHEVNSRNAFRPKIKILFDEEQNEVRGERILNLANFDAQSKRFIYSIVRPLLEEEIEELGN